LTTLELAGFRGEIRRDEPLALHTSLRVGGPADLFLVPADLTDLQKCLDQLEEAEMPFLVIGGGYNLLARDGGFRGAVISLKSFNSMVALDGRRINAGAGVVIGALVRFAGEHGWSGLEFMAGIPGSFGGALTMNAGAHGEAIMDRLMTLTTLRNGMVTERGRDELNYGYRQLHLVQEEIILSASLQLHEGNEAEIAAKIDTFLAHRREVQPLALPNAGSFFKNPAGEQAWRLIDTAGLRGYRIGGAQVSELHSNFLVNRGGATAGDFLELARNIKTAVKNKCGVDLEEEVRIVGEE
jgi:UDP-N-acetylmuramate dehydrogenase